MKAKEAINAQRAQAESAETEASYRTVRRQELAARVPDLRRRDTIIDAEIEALRRRAQAPSDYLTEEERQGLNLVTAEKRR
jgi:hypothetical protein